MPQLIKDSPQGVNIRRGRGRPPKEKSGATLTYRLQIMLSAEDILRIERIKELTGADSSGAAIRACFRGEYDRLVIEHQARTKT